MKFLNPVFLPTLFILTVAATPLVGPNRRAKGSRRIYLRRCATPDSVRERPKRKRVRPAQVLR